MTARKVRRNGREIDLLPREFKLLEYFMRRPGVDGHDRLFHNVDEAARKLPPDAQVVATPATKRDLKKRNEATGRRQRQKE